MVFALFLFAKRLQFKKTQSSKNNYAIGKKIRVNENVDWQFNYIKQTYLSMKRVVFFSKPLSKSLGNIAQ